MKRYLLLNFTFVGIDLLFFKVMKLLAVLLAYFINLLKPIHYTKCSFENKKYTGNSLFSIK